MTVDVYRPPARLGPRYPLWAKLSVIWGIALVGSVLVLIFINSNPKVAFAIILLPIAIVLAVAGSYAAWRIFPDRSPVDAIYRGWGYRRNDTEDPVRPSDPEERQALRRLRRGAITRREYERIIARRHFVHGEITLAQYKEIVRELGAEVPRKPTSVSPPRTTP